MKIRYKPRPFKVVYLGRKRPAEANGKRIILKVQEEKKTEPPIGGVCLASRSGDDGVGNGESLEPSRRSSGFRWG